MSRHPADTLIRAQSRSLQTLLARLRREIIAAAKTGRAVPGIVAQVQRRLLAAEPALAGLMRDGLLAAWLTGGRSVGSVVSPSVSHRGIPPLPGGGGIAATGGLPPTRLPLIERAANDLARRQLLTPTDYAALSDDARRTAFTVARSVSVQSVQTVRDALQRDIEQGGTLREFQRSVRGAVDRSMAAPHRLESLYRTHLAQAYSAGQQDILDHPMVVDEFPYLLYSATHDARTRPDHLEMERHGIQGTAVYRRDDPIWRYFYPPWGWNCRCLVIPLSIEDAARRGIREAVQWLRSGTPPVRPAWVQMPDFRPPSGWSTGRRIQAVV